MDDKNSLFLELGWNTYILASTSRSLKQQVILLCWARQPKVPDQLEIRAMSVMLAKNQPFWYLTSERWRKSLSIMCSLTERWFLRIVASIIVWTYQEVKINFALQHLQLVAKCQMAFEQQVRRNKRHHLQRKWGVHLIKQDIPHSGVELNKPLITKPKERTNRTRKFLWFFVVVSQRGCFESEENCGLVLPFQWEPRSTL